jgi:hypothetical protein
VLLLGLGFFVLKEGQSLRIRQKRCKFSLKVFGFFWVLMDVVLDSMTIEFVQLLDGLNIIRF